jgi:hypothetical protein
MKVLDRFGLLKNIERFYDEDKKFKGHSATLWDWKIYSVPHSNAQLPGNARQVIWCKIIEEIERTS